MTFRTNIEKLEHFLEKTTGHYEQSLMNHLLVGAWKTVIHTAMWVMKVQVQDILQGNNICEWIRNHCCVIISSKNIDIFGSFPKNLPEAKLKRNGLILGRRDIKAA